MSCEKATRTLTCCGPVPARHKKKRISLPCGPPIQWSSQATWPWPSLRRRLSQAWACAAAPRCLARVALLCAPLWDLVFTPLVGRSIASKTPLACDKGCRVRGCRLRLLCWSCRPFPAPVCCWKAMVAPARPRRWSVRCCGQQHRTPAQPQQHNERASTPALLPRPQCLPS